MQVCTLGRIVYFLNLSYRHRGTRFDKAAHTHIILFLHLLRTFIDIIHTQLLSLALNIPTNLNPRLNLNFKTKSKHSNRSLK